MPKPNKKKSVRGRSLLSEKVNLQEKKRSSKSTVAPKISFKYRIAKYVKINEENEENGNQKFFYEVEGIKCQNRGVSKGFCYFDCASKRLVNAPDCSFRGRVRNFKVSGLEGDIEIINEHSKTCKFKPGNNIHDLSKNINLGNDKRIYKTMKIEIEKKLEEESWSTPGEILSWIKLNFPIENHLHYSQVDDIVQYWRRKNNSYKESYIIEHSLNNAGLPFLRAHSTLNIKIHNQNKLIKVAIWCSDFQINRIRLTDHLFIDGTFNIVPTHYSQLLTIMIRDPNTGYVKPAIWSIINSKDEETYFQLFLMIKQILTMNESLELSIKSATLDFELSLINGFKRVFAKTKIIGCLFHFKQALFREALSQGLMKDEDKNATQTLITELGALSWLNNLQAITQEFIQIQENYQDTKYKNLVEYYNKNWLPRLKTGMIDYSGIEDQFRANSVLEKYNSHIKDNLPRSPSWPKFIDFLIKEEAEYVKEAFNCEQRGQISVKSQNFGKAYKPKTLKKKKVDKKKPEKSKKRKNRDFCDLSNENFDPNSLEFQILKKTN